MRKISITISSITVIMILTAFASLGQTNHINVTGTTTGISGDIYHLDGNVGIGLSNPSANLEIKGITGQTNNLFSILASDGSEALKVNRVKELQLFSGFRQTDVSTTSSLYNSMASNRSVVLRISMYNDNWGYHNFMQSYRHGGTIDAPTKAPYNATIYEFDNQVYDGSGYVQASELLFQVEGHVNPGSVKGRITFNTNNGTTQNSEERMRLTPDGRLGIGTTAPKGTLEVVGDEIISSGNLYVENGFIVGGFDTGSDLNLCYGKSAANVGLKIDGTTGNIGIGTTTPGYKLTVNGGIHAQKVRIETTAGADFVFEKDYNLRDLSEVEDFVNTNKHLPEIPSAKEMVNNGVDVNEMQIKLLQKIEELTLYVIDLKKVNDKLVRDVEMLKQ